MNKRLVRILISISFLLFVTFFAILEYDDYLHKQEDLRLPAHLSSYQTNGYYKIDPERILESLEHGDTNVFMPMLEDPLEVEALSGSPQYWTQDDFMLVASALGQFVWGDPMDLEDWGIYFILFSGDCDNSLGFHFAEFTYYKSEGMMYSTRNIEISTGFGLIKWGSGNKYRQPLLRKWMSVDLLGSKISADDALRIANEHGQARRQFGDECGIVISSPQNNDPQNWYLDYIKPPDSITYVIDLDTGDYKIWRTNN